MGKLLVIAAVAALALFALAARPGANIPVVHAATPQIFNVGAANQPYVVPPGVTTVLVEARGGKGGNAGVVTGIASCAIPAIGGVGHQVTTRLTVIPGQILLVNVGGNGTVTAGGANGGGLGGFGIGVPTEGGAGGGGGSDVRTDPATRVIVAGGGGGAGGCGNSTILGTLGGVGGNAETAGGSGVPVPGGGGGGASGATPGTAGTHAGGVPVPTAGTAAGIGGSGGVGLAQTFQGGSGGGGGGGFAGGGGAGAGTATIGSGGGGGGGGSSFVGAGTAGTVIVPHPDGQASVGRVTITPIDPLTVTKSFNPISIQVNGTSTVGIVLFNGNAFPLTGITFTDNLPVGVTVNGAATTFLANPACTVGGGVVSTTATSITLTNGVLAPSASCAIGVPVTSATAGTYVNPSFLVTTTEGVTTNSNTAPLTVTTAPVPNTPVPSPIPSVVVPPPVIVIPQVFQHVPQGIFNGNRSTPTPVVRAVVASVVDPGTMPVLRPPSTGDAGLMTERGSSFVPLIVLAGVLSVGAGAAWRLRAR